MEFYKILESNKEAVKKNIDATGNLGLNIDRVLDCILHDLKSGSFKELKDFTGEVATKSVVGTREIDAVPILYNRIFDFCAECLSQHLGNNTEELFHAAKVLKDYINDAVMYYMNCSLKMQKEVIEKQNDAILELSTPVLPIYKSILLVPIIGTIDTERARQIMENLLSGIVENHAEIALIDISGVPIVDTQVAHHLIKTVQAAKLLGTECILVGIRPELAQTIVKLGIDFSYILTKNTLQSGLEMALKMLKYKIQKTE